MAKEIKRTIETVLNLETGEILDVNDIFRNPLEREAEIFQLRTEIQAQVHQDKATYVCIYCKQSIGIRGHINRRDYYLTHTFRSNDCIIKTNNHLTEEQIRCIKYNGEKESGLHEELKNKIAYYLELDSNVSCVHTEKVYKDLAISKEWKKPDVMAELVDKKIAFELQLSTTFLSVVVARTLFYRARGIYLIWIFPNFSIENHLQQFTQKDVYYNNSFNVYAFDNDAREKSKIDNRLVLKCYYKRFSIVENRLKESWVSKFISIDDLKFNEEKKEVCFYDSVKEKAAVIKLLENKRIEQEETEQNNLANYKTKRALQYLREFYRNDIEPRTNDCPLDQIETEREIEVFNDGLGFNGDKLNVIASLFQSGEKPRFLEFVCRRDNILIDTQNIFVRNEPLFQYLIYLDSQSQFYRKITLLFRKGYSLSNTDYGHFESLYENNYFNVSERERDYVERWAFLHGLNSLWYKQDTFRLVEVKKVLFALSSIKNDLCIGYKFTNLKQITMNFLTYSSEFGILYIRALKAFGRYEKQLLDDKSGKLKAKIDEFEKNPPEQNKSFDRIFFQIFPEL